MSQLTIVAHITANSDQVEFVKGELQKLVPATLAEEGCIQYDLHQDNERPEHFMFYENWESEAAWRSHMVSEHIKGYKAATEGAVAEIQVFQMSGVAV